MPDKPEQKKDLGTELMKYFRILHEIASLEFHFSMKRTAKVLRSAENDDEAAKILSGGTNSGEHTFHIGSSKIQRMWIKEKEACIKAFGKEVPQPESPEVAAFMALT